RPGGGGLRPAPRRGRRPPGARRGDRAHAQQQRDGRARRDDLREGARVIVAVLGPGRIGRQIALAFALGGRRVLLVDAKTRAPEEHRAVFADARREIARDLALMAEEGVIEDGDAAPALDRVESRVGLDGLGACGFVQEALPELLDLKRDVLGRLSARVGAGAIIASTSSTISPKHLADAVEGPERFLVAHWLNPAHIIPLVEVVPGRATNSAIVARTVELLEGLGKVV